MLTSFHAYFSTPEGATLAREIEAITNRIYSRQKENSLTEVERGAYYFIQRKIRAGSSPSVRGIAQHLGFKSSRSGFKIIQSLIEKSIVKRDEGGHIVIIAQKPWEQTQLSTQK